VLRLYRRHRVSCPRRSERYRRCACPIYVEGSLAGEHVRRSLDLTSWEAATDLIARWNASGEIGTSRADIPAIREAVSKFVSDANTARNTTRAAPAAGPREPVICASSSTAARVLQRQEPRNSLSLALIRVRLRAKKAL
jgi:hypothetical protein